MTSLKDPCEPIKDRLSRVERHTCRLDERLHNVEIDQARAAEKREAVFEKINALGESLHSLRRNVIWPVRILLTGLAAAVAKFIVDGGLSMPG